MLNSLSQSAVQLVASGIEPCTDRCQCAICRDATASARANRDRAGIGAAVIVERDDFVIARFRLPRERRAVIARAEKDAIGEPINLRHVRLGLGAQGKRTTSRAVA